MNRYTHHLSTLLFAGALGLLAACGDDDDTDGPKNTMDASTDAGPDGGVGPDGSVAEERYAVVTQTAVSGATPVSYVSVTRTLTSSTPVSTEGALPVQGRALTAGEPGSGTVFVSSGSGPELTKYTLDANDELVEAGKISFPGARAIGEYASQVQFVSPSKAYFFDTHTAQIFPFNPTTLALGTPIALPDMQIADTTLTFSSALPVERDGKIVFAAGWRSGTPTTVLKVVSQVALVVLDTTTDTVTILRDTRCGYVRDAVEGSDGRVYLATEAWGSAVHRLAPENGPAPCLLRTDAALTQIDPDFQKDLNAIGGGVTGSLTQSRDGKVYTRVLDESAVTIMPTTPARVLASLPAWAWAEVTLGDEPTATKVPGAPLGTGSLVVFDLKDTRYVADIKEGGTDLVDITRGIGATTISTTGNTFSVAQIR